MSFDLARGWAIALVAISIFGIALTVRLLYRSDRAARFDEIMPYQSFISHRRAVKILAGAGILVWDDADPSKIKQIRRPPGYPAFLAGVYEFTGADLRRAQLVQIVLDALAASLVALAGVWLISMRAGIAAGFLYALSPHLAVFSTIVTPDAVASWPVLAGGLLFIAALQRQSRWGYAFAVAAGLAIGASCWLTAQGLTLPIFVGSAGVVVALPGERRRAALLGLSLFVTVMAVVAPLAIRNAALYGALVPIRPGLGTTMLEGLGVYDANLPSNDGQLLQDEVARFGRPDYLPALYYPDGLMRESDRLHRALDAIAARPVWFVRVMLDRMGLMLTYEYQGDLPWPDNTAYAGTVVRGEGGAIERGVRVLVVFAHWLLFRSWLIWLLVAAGVAALLRAGQWRTALLIGVVPLHHLLLQSFLLTEYKYTLPVHAWFFMLAGAAVLWIPAGKGKRGPEEARVSQDVESD